jgi:hypothetical protein
MSSLHQLIEPICQLMNEFSQSVGEFTTGNLEMLLWFWRQHTYWQKCQAYPNSKQTSAEVLTGSLAFLALIIHRSFLRVFIVYQGIYPFSIMCTIWFLSHSHGA